MRLLWEPRASLAVGYVGCTGRKKRHSGPMVAWMPGKIWLIQFFAVAHLRSLTGQGHPKQVRHTSRFARLHHLAGTSYGDTRGYMWAL